MNLRQELAEPIQSDYSTAEAVYQESVGSSSTWVIDPYKSEHYDAACAPAIVFNLEKKKELKCLYIKCLQDAKNGAFSKESCSEMYDYRNCLYVEGAQTRLTGGPSDYFWGSFMKATAAAVITTLISTVFQLACGGFYKVTTSHAPYADKPPLNWLCGSAVVLLTGLELISDTESLFHSFDHQDLGNNCEGINYEE